MDGPPEGRIPKGLLILAGICLLASCGTPYGIYHRTVEGDTLYGLAEKYNADLDLMLELNKIQDPDVINVDQQIFIPIDSKDWMTGVRRADRKDERPMASEAGEGHPEQDAASIRETDLPETEPGSTKQREDPVSPAPGDGGGTGVQKAGKSDEPVRVETAGIPTKKNLRFVWPAKGTVINRFGTHGGVEYEGIDVAAMEGSPVIAAEEGQVIFAGKMPGYGKMVVIKHNAEFTTVYAHNRKNLVDSGEHVDRGQVIAEMGKTGRAPRVHLHFEIRRKRKPVDPLGYLPKRS